MINLLNKALLAVCLVLHCIFFSGCSDDSCRNPEKLNDHKSKAVQITSCEVDCSVSFENQSRAGQPSTWQNGDLLFVIFGPYKDEPDIINGDVYTNTGVLRYVDGNWSLFLNNPHQTLEVVLREECIVMSCGYGKELKEVDENNNYVLTPYDPLYASIPGRSGIMHLFEYLKLEESNAYYSVSEDGKLFLSAALNPYFTRIKICGERDETFTLLSVAFANCINKELCQFQVALGQELTQVKCTNEENGAFYTPYFYGIVVSEEEGDPFYLKIGENTFGRTNCFEPGQSYEIIAPSIENPGSWSFINTIPNINIDNYPDDEIIE